MTEFLLIVGIVLLVGALWLGWLVYNAPLWVDSQLDFDGHE